MTKTNRSSETQLSTPKIKTYQKNLVLHINMNSSAKAIWAKHAKEPLYHMNHALSSLPTECMYMNKN